MRCDAYVVGHGGHMAPDGVLAQEQRRVGRQEEVLGKAEILHGEHGPRGLQHGRQRWRLLAVGWILGAGSDRTTAASPGT